MSAGEAAVGRGRERQPEWFSDAAGVLQPLLDEKNAAYRRYLQGNSVVAKREFRRQQRRVKLAVDNAKEEWICKAAGDAESAKKDGRKRWMCIRQLQMTYRGRRPRRPATLIKENGDVTTSPDKVKRQWHHHFSKILNLPSMYNQDVIEEMARLPHQLELDDPPTMEELSSALSRLRKRKAGESSQSYCYYGSVELRTRLLQVMQDVWEVGAVVDDWKDAVIVPIPKTGDIRECDNWRGISLLDVVGKVETAGDNTERILPDSQCGFRQGRGCTDMIFAAGGKLPRT